MKPQDGLTKADAGETSAALRARIRELEARIRELRQTSADLDRPGDLLMAREILAHSPTFLFRRPMETDATALGYFGPIGVGSAYRKQGTGKALLQACLDDAQAAGKKGVAMVTRDGAWLASRALLEKLGFVLECVVRFSPDDDELNLFMLPSDLERSTEDTEKLYFDIIAAVADQVKIPVALKISYYFTNLASMIRRLSETSIKGLVLFNRFYSPDIDLDIDWRRRDEVIDFIYDQ